MKIIVYGQARSGTTILSSIISKHPNIGEVSYEPYKNFNDKQMGESYNLWEVKHDPVLFANSVDELFESYDVNKSIIGNIPENNLSIFFKHSNKVVFTRRKNLLRASVSFCLAMKTGVWQQSKKQNYTEDFEPIDIKTLKYNIDFFRNKSNYAKQILIENNINYYELFYEDFFFSNDREFQLYALHKFLGLKICEDNERAICLMKNARLNNERIYLKIPNVYEIEKELGSDENGWLLNEGLQL